jgi:hypothetical protein
MAVAPETQGPADVSYMMAFSKLLELQQREGLGTPAGPFSRPASLFIPLVEDEIRGKFYAVGRQPKPPFLEAELMVIVASGQP